MAARNLPVFTNPVNITPINVVVTDRPPYAVQNASAPYGWSGMLVQLIPVLFQVAGINASFNFYPSPVNGGGTLQRDGSWNGVTGELIAQRADIAAFPLVQSPGRPNVIDFSFSYNEDGLGILVKKEVNNQNGASLFLKPFSYKLWAVLIATVLGMGLCLHLLAYVSPLGGFAIKRMRNVTAGMEEQRYVIEDVSESFFVDVLMAAVANSPEPRGKSWSIRLPSIAFYFFMLITISSYTANFASYLTVNQFSTVVNNLQDLKRGGLNFTINTGGATYTYFTRSLDPTILTLQPKLSTVVGTDPGLDSVRSGAVSAFIAEAPTLRYYAGKQPCDVAVVGKSFGPSVYVLGLQYNSPLTPAINAAMLELKGNGYLDQLQRIWIDDASVCNNAPDAPLGALSPSDFTGLWYLLFAAVAFGFFWAGLERFLLHLLARYPCLRERLEHWKNKAAARGKNFDFTRAFSVPLRRTASIFVRNKTQKVVRGHDDAHRLAPASVKESATERAARLAVEKFDREKAARKVGMLW